jgi:hypothetical protein
MTHPASAAPTPSSNSVGVPATQRARIGGRWSHIVTPCRNLATKFFQNPRWGVMFTFGRFRIVSDAVVFLRRSPIPRPSPHVPSLFRGLDLDTALLDMRREGVHAGINLDAETVSQITRFALSEECYWPGDPRVRFRYANRSEAERRSGSSILLGRYYDIEDRCPAIRAISHDPVLLYLAASYMGAPAGQIEARLWWSFVGDATSAERLKADQGFHYDLHDYRSLAFFFHLTDVDDGSGPHVHVKGSHTHKPLRLLLGESRQASDEDLARQYGAKNLMTLCGPPGFGFATDPFGYHKGAPPTKRDRLMLRIRFTINDDGSRVDRSAPPTMTSAPAAS